MNRRSMLATTAAVLALVPFARNARAHGYEIGALEIGHPWARATAPGAPTGAAYFSVENTGTEPDRLVSASFAGAEKTEIHQMSMENGVMKMAALPDGLPIPPGTTLKLESGGYHIMLIGLKQRLLEGDRVPITLVFEKAGSIEVELAVEDKPPAGHEHDAHQKTSS